MARVIFDTDRCKGCGLCVTACPKKIVHINNDVVNAIGYNPAEVTEMDNSLVVQCVQLCVLIVLLRLGDEYGKNIDERQ